jgi:uncharacterized protein YerC
MWIIDLNERLEIMKLLKEKRINVSVHWNWQWLFGQDSRNTENKSVNGQMRLYETKKLSTVKETISRVKRQLEEWGGNTCKLCI